MTTPTYPIGKIVPAHWQDCHEQSFWNPTVQTLEVSSIFTDEIAPWYRVRSKPGTNVTILTFASEVRVDHQTQWVRYTLDRARRAAVAVTMDNALLTEINGEKFYVEAQNTDVTNHELIALFAWRQAAKQLRRYSEDDWNNFSSTPASAPRTPSLHGLWGYNFAQYQKSEKKEDYVVVYSGDDWEYLVSFSGVSQPDPAVKDI